MEMLSTAKNVKNNGNHSLPSPQHVSTWMLPPILGPQLLR